MEFLARHILTVAGASEMATLQKTKTQRVTIEVAEESHRQRLRKNPPLRQCDGVEILDISGSPGHVEVQYHTDAVPKGKIQRRLEGFLEGLRGLTE